MLRYGSIALTLVMFAVVAGGQTTSTEGTRIAYGAATTSFGELLIPSGGGPFPVAVLIHGGMLAVDSVEPCGHARDCEHAGSARRCELESYR